jgi:hypothetical protein
VTIHEATIKTLSQQENEYLNLASVVFADQLFDDIATLTNDKRPDAIDETWVISHLPATRRSLYTPVFVKGFLACVLTVSWKHRSDEAHSLASVAEELALNALLRHAETLAELDGVEIDFSDYHDYFFEDTDFERLFDPAEDGFEEDEWAARMGYANLAFKDWFKPFRTTNHVHPYVDDSLDGETES